MVYRLRLPRLLIALLLITSLPMFGWGWETNASKMLAACKKGDANQVARLLQNKVNANTYEYWSGDTCLICATRAESVAAVHSLLLYGAIDTPNAQGESALIIAAQCPQDNKNGEEIIRLLLHHGSYINMVSKQNRSALMEAVRAGNANVVRMLLDGRAYPEMKDDAGNTALSYAALSGRLAIVQMLLEAGAYAGHRNDACQTPLDLAQQNNHAAVIAEFEADRIKKEAEKLHGPSVETVEGMREALKKMPIDQQYKKRLNLDIEEAFGDLYDRDKIRPYLRLVFSLPWNKTTSDTLELRNAQQILDDSFYGLQDVKEAIIEYIAAIIMKGEGPAPILCLAGPPGIGKTAIAQIIAKSLGRKYGKIGLSGVREPEKLRGFLRTWIGSRPGDMIEAMRLCGTKNPVILLDEMDKMSTAASAVLLEMLDPNQNSSFKDDYLEIPFDLSQVIFIATVNDITQVPAPLLDRMHIISLPGYLSEEKKIIAQHYLIDQVKKEIGIQDCAVDFESEALAHLIEKYTLEAGVRQTKLLIKRVLSKIVVRYLLEKEVKVEKTTVTLDMLEQLLGHPPFTDHAVSSDDLVGMTNGLFWSSMGGGTHKIEAVLVPRTGGSSENLLLTGQLQDVMQESAHIALSYALSKAEQFGINLQKLDSHMIHIHIPEGATPKDGPSAGVAFFTSIVSVLSDRAIKAGYAMSGEINLRGQVIAVGGLDQKLLGAKRVGIMNVFVPEENKSDIEKLEKKGITKDMNIICIKTVDEIINQLLR